MAGDSDAPGTAPIAAAIQMTSGPDVDANLRAAETHLAMAAAQRATLAVLPENFACVPQRESDRVAAGEADGEGPIQSFLAAQARAHGLWIVAGSVPLLASPDRVSASCLVYDATGRRVARYDKIHLFDCAVPESDEAYRESASIDAGATPVVVDTPVGRMGLAICYDLRFPELFRELLVEGMEVVALPAAFTARTGRAHWEVLLRARAIENLCWVVAAAQQGRHPNGRDTHGHSMIVDPWGRVVECLPEGQGVVAAAIDLTAQAGMRRDFPALEHRRIPAPSRAPTTEQTSKGPPPHE